MEVNNYPSWLVSIEQAIKLKEIGFDKPSQLFFSKQYQELTICSDNIKPIKDVLLSEGFILQRADLYNIYPYSQVFQWFREKGFNITLENHENSTKFMFYNMKINEGKHFKGEFSNYEEAREALLNKLIEVYKKLNK